MSFISVQHRQRRRTPVYNFTEGKESRGGRGMPLWKCTAGKERDVCVGVYGREGNGCFCRRI
jgi:hypothetical protein